MDTVGKFHLENCGHKTLVVVEVGVPRFQRRRWKVSSPDLQLQDVGRGCRCFPRQVRRATIDRKGRR
ncbi:unnamed protein product [Linum trigynum]|uniref:Uncharacterized protein n=1 Tax=Linum trigynum TaxID=586398 RepID=A0AAV2F0Q7_9ROSI